MGEPGRGPEHPEIDHALLAGVLVPVTSGRPGRRAHPKRLTCTLFVPGPVALEGADTYVTGDAVRFTVTGGQRVTAMEPAEILVWEMHAALAA